MAVNSSHVLTSQAPAGFARAKSQIWSDSELPPVEVKDQKGGASVSTWVSNLHSFTSAGSVCSYLSAMDHVHCKFQPGKKRTKSRSKSRSKSKKSKPESGVGHSFIPLFLPPIEYFDIISQDEHLQDHMFKIEMVPQVKEKKIPPKRSWKAFRWSTKR